MAEEKASSIESLEEFFATLIQSFEIDPDRPGSKHYFAAKTFWLARTDEIGLIFRKRLQQHGFMTNQ